MTAEQKAATWRDYDPGAEYAFSWCPLMNQRCLGAVCALWNSRLKRCNLAVLASALSVLQAQQK